MSISPTCNIPGDASGRARVSTMCASTTCGNSFASLALALGEDLPMIGKLLGHTQVQTTARYAHLARDTVKVSAARIDDSIERDLTEAE